MNPEAPHYACEGKPLSAMMRNETAESRYESGYFPGASDVPNAPDRACEGGPLSTAIIADSTIEYERVDDEDEVYIFALGNDMKNINPQRQKSFQSLHTFHCIQRVRDFSVFLSDLHFLH